MTSEQSAARPDVEDAMITVSEHYRCTDDCWNNHGRKLGEQGCPIVRRAIIRAAIQYRRAGVIAVMPPCIDGCESRARDHGYREFINPPSPPFDANDALACDRCQRLSRELAVLDALLTQSPELPQS